MSRFQLYTVILVICMVAIVELADAQNAKLKDLLKASENSNRLVKREAADKLKGANNKLKGGYYYNSYDSYYYPYYDSYYGSGYYDSYYAPYYDSYGSYDSYYYDSYYRK